MLLASTRDAPDRRKVKTSVSHAREDNIQRFNPHCDRRIDFIFRGILAHAANNAIVREILIENDSFFVDGFKVGSDGDT